jgi:predicted PhzF superfamily epimerase YddE/YHI9
MLGTRMAMLLALIDAFAHRPFEGNAAAVCLLSEPRDAAWMQALAAELAQSETAFVSARADGGFDLRWFTPTVEEELCGHATLASAHALWSWGVLDRAVAARFHTRSGLLMARFGPEAIELDFPTERAELAPAPPGLIEGLHVRPRWVGRNRLDFLVEVGSEAEVRALQPDLRILAGVPCRGVIVTARGAEPFDFVSRYFAPREAVPEDPATGSAHCCLGAFWADRVGHPWMRAFQASPRGGIVEVRVDGARTILRGAAVTILSGELHV